MKPLINYFADSLYGIVVFAMLIAVLGIVALISIPVDILPSFNTPAVQVQEQYTVVKNLALPIWNTNLAK